MVHKKGQGMTDKERQELPTSLFILSGTNIFRRAAVWFVRWVVFEWTIILTIIGKILKSLLNITDRMRRVCNLMVCIN